MTRGELRALQPRGGELDAIDPADPNIRIATSGGITTANIMPGSGNVMGGQTAYVKLRGATMEQIEEAYINMVLQRTNNNKTKAADILGISVRTLHNRLGQLSNRKADSATG